MTKKPIEVLFPALRHRVLAAMLLHPRRTWYLSQLARHLKKAPSQLHRELAALVRAGILRRTVEGRQTYFEPDPDCPFLPELQGLVQKTLGMPVILAEALGPFRERIACAFVYGSLARGEERSASDVDLMVVGDVSLSELVPRLKRAEHALGRSVNPTLYSAKDFARGFRDEHHFLQSVMRDRRKIFVLGNASDLETMVSGPSTQAASNKPIGNRRAARRRGNQAPRR